jgi:release factor glutamine methyltransferase
LARSFNLAAKWNVRWTRGLILETVSSPLDQEQICEQLERAGFVAAQDEAEELTRCAKGDPRVLSTLLARRLNGEPLAWITGSVTFCGVEVLVDPSVYVPRWQSEPLVRQAVLHLPDEGVAVDVCTGSGAIAKVLIAARPRARVVGCDVEELAVACAQRNGIEVYQGDLFTPLPRELEHNVDVVIGVVPYVPTGSLEVLPHDTLRFESELSYDGGANGTDFLRRAITEASRFLRPGGRLLLELGADQAELLSEDLRRGGYRDVDVLFDEDGDLRGIDAEFAS